MPRPRRMLVAGLSLLLALTPVAADDKAPLVVARRVGLPEHALVRIGKPQPRYDGPLYLVAYSRDGQQLASAGYDGLVRLYDAGGGEVRRLAGHKGPAYSLAFSPDGKTLVSGGTDRSVRLWDTGSGKELRRFEGHESGVLAVAFAPDGQTIATESHDKTVRLWDAATGKERHRLDGHKSNGTSNIVFSPDSTILAAVGADHGINLWETRSGKLLRSCAGHTADAETLAFTADGKALVSGSLDMTIRVWDVATGRETKQIKGLGSWVNAVAVSPDGKTLAAGFQSRDIRLFDRDSGKELRRLIGHRDRLKSLTFAPDGKALASGALDGNVRLWDVATGADLLEAVVESALSPDGTLLALALQGQDVLHLCEPRTGREVRPLRGQKAAALALAFSGDGTRLATWGADGIVRLWDPATGKAAGEFATKSDVGRLLALSPDGKVALGYGSLDMRLRRWDTATGQELPVPAQDPQRTGFPAVSRDGRMVAFMDYQAGQVHVWDIPEGKELNAFKDPSLTSSSPLMAFSADNRTLLICRDDQTTVCELLTSKMRRRQKDANPTALAAVSPDGRMMARLWDGQIRLTELETGKELAAFAVGRQATARVPGWSPDGRTLVSWGPDPSVLVWDASEAVKKLRPRDEKLTARRLESCWEDLSHWDAVEAGTALGSLATAPGQAIELLRKRLTPVTYPKAEAGRVARLIADLDADDFARRLDAHDELVRLGPQVEAAIRAELRKRGLTASMRSGLGDVLESLGAEENGPAALRRLRAIELLERLGTKEAADLLAALAGGAPESRVTREAKESLARLRRPGAPKAP